ncbi:polyphosphate polymerase domain-containing protein [uncultured Clostridium sp.]|uniref:polyphosphate polymerase domain-containing protein n=1 Tax=uncultured Clostridium sp. TaxID=59620 RepID=UPI0025D1E531|nr:polyphosphate polymerase domain-containing protein [uncultured Clostridium sp.]
MLDVLREEKKYKISLKSKGYVLGYISNILHGDAFNGTRPYLVRSLYFDSIGDEDYFNKQVGTDYHKKIRLRVYSPDSDNAKLEIKEKSGSMQRKRSLTVSKEDAIELINRNYEVLKNYKEDLAEELYMIMVTKLYVPRCIVEYERIAFGTPENNIRITFDSNVRSNEGNFNLFSNELNTYPVMNSDDVIFEVKYNNFLFSYIKDVIRCIDKIEVSASKYCMSRRFGLEG